MAAENTLSSSLSFTPQTDIKITSLTIVVASIFLFLTIIFLFLLYLYAKHHWRRPRSPSLTLPSNNPPLAPHRGLPSSLLASLPITLYKPADFPDGIECAVCLSELAAGEEARLLPQCGHGFHLDCIDAWFRSNSSCPVCRCAVEGDGGNRSDSEGASAASASSERMLLPMMISVPVRSAEGILFASGAGAQRAEEEEKRSPKVWSFRRILSRGTCPSPSPSPSPRVGDIERGMGGSGAQIGEGSLSSPVSIG